MTAINPIPLPVRISNEIGYVSSISWAHQHGEICIVGEGGLAVLKTTGEIIRIIPLSSDDKIIAKQRTSQGWQLLSQRNLQLGVFTIPNNGSADVLLEDAIENPHTASWSSCGKHIAVGSVGNALSVWKTDNGALCWRKSIKWDGDDEFLTPPTLSVAGWSQDNKYIVTIAEYLASIAVFVWDADKGEVCTTVD